MHVERGGVDDQVGVAAQPGQHLALALQPVEQPAVALERVRAAGGLLAAHQDLVGGLEEDQRRVPAGGAVGEVRGEGLEERPGADVDDHGDRLGGSPALVDEPDDVLEQLGGRLSMT